MKTYNLIALSVIALLLTITFASAGIFESKSYDEAEQTVSIDKALLGIKLPEFLGGGKVADVKLETNISANYDPQTNRHYYIVSSGYTKIAELNITAYQYKEGALGEVEFYDVDRNTGSLTEKLKDFDYKYLTYEEKERDTYQIEEYTNKNGTQSYRQVKNGTEKYYVEKWENMPSSDINGTITVGIFTNVGLNDYIEWIPTLYGKRINEWATYQVIWEAFDGGTINSTRFQAFTSASQGSGQLTANTVGDSNGMAGIRIIANDYNWNETNFTVSMSFDSGTGGWDLLGVGWAQSSISGVQGYQWTQSGSTGGNSRVIGIAEGTLLINWDPINSTSIKISRNGVLAGYINKNNTGAPTFAGSQCCGQTGQAIFFEINITLVAPDALNVSTTILSPANNTITSNTTVYFQGYTNATNGNVTNATLIVQNGTTTRTNFTTFGAGLNSSMINLALSEFYGDISYNWSMISCAINSTGSALCSPSPVNYTLIGDVSPPTITLNNPRNISFSTLPSNLSFNYSVTDINLGSCWYWTSENATNTTVTCNQVFNITFQSYGIKSVYFAANDTLGNTNQTLTYFQLVSENSQTFNAIVTEGTSQTYEINISYNSTNLTSPSAVLVYNGTSHVASVSGSGDNIRFSDTLTAPLVDANTNITLYWNITFGSRTFQSTIKQQTILNTQILQCTNSSAIFIFRVVDEATQVLIPNATMEWSFQFRNFEDQLVLTQNISTTVNPNGLCSTVPLPGGEFTIDGTVKYYNETHAIEYYEIRDYSWEGNYTTENITLYDLILTDSTDFQVTFNGLDFLPAPNVILYLERQYIPEGTFKVVEAPITDSNGQTILHMVQNNIYYNIRAIRDGVVLGTYSNIRAFCQDTFGTCTIVLTARETDIFVPDYNSITDTGILFLGSPTLNTTTQLVSASFVSTDSAQKNVTIRVNRNDVFGNETLCINSINAVSGTVTCQLDPLFSDTSVITNIYVDGQLAVLESTEGQSLGFGSIGYLAWFVATLVLILIFADNKNMVIIMMLVSYIGAVLCGLTIGKIIGLGTGLGSAGIWIIAVTIVALYQLNKRRIE